MGSFRTTQRKGRRYASGRTVGIVYNAVDSVLRNEYDTDIEELRRYDRTYRMVKLRGFACLIFQALAYSKGEVLAEIFGRDRSSCVNLMKTANGWILTNEDIRKEYYVFLRNVKSVYELLLSSDTLILKESRESFDAILAGQRSEIYRRVCPFWESRLYSFSRFKRKRSELGPSKPGLSMKDSSDWYVRRWSRIIVKRGSSDEQLCLEWQDTEIGMGKAEWGAPEDKDVFIIRLKTTF